MVSDLFRKKYESCVLACNDGQNGYGCACEKIVDLYREIHPERVFRNHTIDYVLLTSIENCYFCENYTRDMHMLTVREVSEMIHVHPNTLRRWSNKKKIKTYRINERGDRRYDKEDVIRFIRNYNPLKDDK